MGSVRHVCTPLVQANLLLNAASRVRAGVPEGDAEGYIWLLLVDNLANNTSFVIRCRTNAGGLLAGHWSFKSKPMSTTKS